MPVDSQGMNHFYKRKHNILQRLKEYVKEDKLKDFMDKSIYIVAIVTPLLTIPQILLIWIEKDATNISLITWIGYFIAALFWLSYGIVHRAIPIILTNSLWIILKAFVIILTFIYG